MAPTTADASERDALLLRKAVDLAAANVLNSGGPFGAIVVAADGREFEGLNRVTANLDPTAHAEVTAIRNACQRLGTFSLDGATLYTSCEPCPMCLASTLWARIDRVLYAADRTDAAAAGFDDAAFYQYFDQPSIRDTVMPVRQLRLDSAVEPFNAWNASGNRLDY
ncbi:nucleoside deaminase [Saxibacter everestensis]|uniref:Nucleoside deaminase n=1 Tax=Saxibacter everestensis TaxID=2909229 RepID=A0ABY8QQV1_9MICO|nr:nucleoside deaminase [Brevibacteriaceae bacterium ZFBP1038]